MKLLPQAVAMLMLASSQAFAGALADLSVFDRTEGRPLKVHWHEGRAYVAGKPGNEYRVTVRNRLGEDILAVVSVDGINAVTGQTADPSQSGYVLTPQRSYDVLGWRKSLSETAAFYFTTLPDSYAARTGRPDQVGVIGVAVFRRKAEEVRPQYAPAPSSRKDSGAGPAADASRSAEAASQIGTGHGRREASHVRNVAFERASAAPAELVTLYYARHANLVARGIIRAPVPVAPLPRPFPGFVPDPA